jgi:uncharacterized phage-associated protein
MSNVPISAVNAARLFLLLSEEPLDLYSLMYNLYYAQGIYLAMYKTRLFDDVIVRWKIGPVSEKAISKLSPFINEEFMLPKNINIGGVPTSSLIFKYANLLPFFQKIIKMTQNYSRTQILDKIKVQSPFLATPLLGKISEELMTEYFLNRTSRL